MSKDFDFILKQLREDATSPRSDRYIAKKSTAGDDIFSSWRNHLAEILKTPMGASASIFARPNQPSAQFKCLAKMEKLITVAFPVLGYDAMHVFFKEIQNYTSYAYFRFSPITDGKLDYILHMATIAALKQGRFSKSIVPKLHLLGAGVKFALQRSPTNYFQSSLVVAVIQIAVDIIREENNISFLHARL